MHLCLTVECITSGLQFLVRCLSVTLSILVSLYWVSPPRSLFQLAIGGKLFSAMPVMHGFFTNYLSFLI